jgi:hypothetical protein
VILKDRQTELLHQEGAGALRYEEISSKHLKFIQRTELDCEELRFVNIDSSGMNDYLMTRLFVFRS